MTHLKTLVRTPFLKKKNNPQNSLDNTSATLGCSNWADSKALASSATLWVKSRPQQKDRLFPSWAFKELKSQTAPQQTTAFFTAL